MPHSLRLWPAVDWCSCGHYELDVSIVFWWWFIYGASRGASFLKVHDSIFSSTPDLNLKWFLHLWILPWPFTHCLVTRCTSVSYALAALPLITAEPGSALLQAPWHSTAPPVLASYCFALGSAFAWVARSLFTSLKNHIFKPNVPDDWIAVLTCAPCWRHWCVGWAGISFQLEVPSMFWSV